MIINIKYTNKTYKIKLLKTEKWIKKEGYRIIFNDFIVL